MKVETADRRETLTRQRVLEAAVLFADREGVESLSMRRLASDLGVEAMSLYTHVRSKDDMLDGMIEVVVTQIPIPTDGAGWKASIREMVRSARAVVLRHRWAPRIIETRTAPGPAMMGYLDTVMRLLRQDGFSIDLTHHALHLLGSRMLGFTQDLFDDSPDLGPEEAAALAEQIGGAFPHVAEMAMAVTHEGGLGGCDDDFEFELGLAVILDGLEELHRRESSPS